MGQCAARSTRLFGRYDIVIGLRFAPSSTALLARLIGAKTRVGFTEAARSPGTLTVDAGPQPVEMSYRVASLIPIRALGIEADPAYEPATWMGPQVAANVDRVLASVGLTDGAPFAVLQISCDWGCNELDSRKWARIADGIAQGHGLRCVVIGVDDPHEMQKFAEVAALAAVPPASLHGRTSLAELLELARRASLAVATDERADPDRAQCSASHRW